MKLSECLNGKNENLNCLKFVLAILVIYSHSYSICDSKTRDALSNFTEGDLGWGKLSVTVFLFISGLYVTKSLFACKDWKEYLRKRAVKIFPAFSSVILLTVFIMGPIVTDKSFIEYFTSGKTYGYLKYIMLIPVYELPGVFEGNPYPTVNGSLWTVVLECICYLLILIAYKCRMLTKAVLKFLVPIMVAAAILVYAVHLEGLYQYKEYLRPLFCCFMGVAYYVFRDKIVINNRNAVISAAGLLLLAAVGYLSLGVILFMPYLICRLIYCRPLTWISKIEKNGNYSYCMYLLAYPIQQITWQYNFFGVGRNAVGNTVVSAILDLILGMLLYYKVERPVNQHMLGGGKRKVC